MIYYKNLILGSQTVDIIQSFCIEKSVDRYAEEHGKHEIIQQRKKKPNFN